MKNRVAISAGIALAMLGGIAQPAVAFDEGDNFHEPHVIPACNDGGIDPANDVCFESATMTRDGTELDRETFRLTYQDESVAFGGGSAEFTLRAQVEETFDNDSFFGDPKAGDRGRFTILYPVKNTLTGNDDTANPDGSDLRGVDLNRGIFAVTGARNFTFSKDLINVGGFAIEIIIDITYEAIALRPGCNFSEERDEDFGLGFPTPECEAANTGDEATDSTVFVQNDVAFFAESDDLFGSAFDGGFLNYQGNSVTYFIEPFQVLPAQTLVAEDETEIVIPETEIPGAFGLQLIGPKFALGETLNSGAVEAFFPQAAVDIMFGENFDVAEKFASSRVDAAPGVRTVQELTAESGLSVEQPESGGILVKISDYKFSAPVFSFASSDRPQFTALSAESSEATGGSSGATGGSSGQGAAAVAVATQPELAATGVGDNWLLLGLGSATLIAVGTIMVSQSARGRGRLSI